MKIFGIGLHDYEQQAIQDFLKARRPLSPAERAELGVPEEFTDQSAKRKTFAFWLAVGMRLQDRPLFFSIGVLAMLYALLSSIWVGARYLWSLAT